MINITNYPVAVVATPRTGSTALAESLAFRHDLRLFSEPYDTFPPPRRSDKHYKGTHEDFFNWYTGQRSEQFLVKFMPHQINSLNPFPDILNNSFKIKLTREDEVAQISSFYIAEKRQKFFKNNDETSQRFVVPIDETALFQTAGFILNLNYLLDNLKVDWDVEATYESLGIIEGSSKTRSDIPDNVNEINQEVRNLLVKWY
jgi:hypothetical protein